MKILNVAILLILALTTAFSTIAPCTATIDSMGYSTVSAVITDAAGSCASIDSEDVIAEVGDDVLPITKSASSCKFSFTKYFSPGSYSVHYTALIGTETQTSTCTFAVPNYELTMSVHTPSSNYKITKGTSSLYFQASIYYNGLIDSSALLTAEIVDESVSSTVSAGYGGVFSGTLDISDLAAGIYTIRFTAVDGTKTALSYRDFQIVESETQSQSASGALKLNVLSPEQDKKYPSRNIFIRTQVTDKNGLATKTADVGAVLYLFTNGEWTEQREFEIDFASKYYEESISIENDGKYKLAFTATKDSDIVSQSIVFYVGEYNTTAQPSAYDYNVYLTVASPTSQKYAFGKEVPLQVFLKDSNGLFINGEVMVSIYDSNNSLVTTKTLTQMRNAYYSTYTFAQPGVYLLFFEARFKDYRANKTAFAYIGTEPADSNKLNIKIITPKPDTYPEDVKIIVRARISHQDVPLANATVFAVVNELEYQMIYDRYGEYYIKLPKLPEDNYQLSVLAKSGDFVGEAKSEFAISKHRLDIELVYPEEEASIFIKRDDPVTFSFNVYNELQDLAHGAEVIVTFKDPNAKEFQSQIHQTETGEYTGVVYMDQPGHYDFTATAILPGYVPDSVDSEFTLDIEDVFVFGIELETLLNIILIIAIVILAAGILRHYVS